MQHLNANAADVMTGESFGDSVRAATDVTGFSLVGHLLQMLGSGNDAEIDTRSVPLLPDAVKLAELGYVPGGSKRNLADSVASVDGQGIDDALLSLMFDAQTSGGLLIAIDGDVADRFVDALRAVGEEPAARIGSIVGGTGRVRLMDR
jgi:selenide,water dikinase